jgi:preprotein translocase subunit SecG
VVVAAIFMVTSFSLAILAKQRNFSSTVIDMQPKSEPAAPAAAPPAQPSENSPPAGETSEGSH